MRKLMVAAILGGILAFGWSSVSWMVLELHSSSLHDIPREAHADFEAVMKKLPEPGVYHYPGLPGSEDAPPTMEALAAKAKAGPVVTQMMVRPKGLDLENPAPYGFSLFASVLAAGLSAWLLARSGPSARFGARFAFVIAVGLAGTLLIRIPDWAWWSYPAEFMVPHLVDHLVSWALIALVQAALIRPVSGASA